MSLSKEKIESLLLTSMLRANHEFTDPPVCLKIRGEFGDQIFSTLGNFSLFIAPPKVGKTTVSAVFIIALLKNQEYMNLIPSLPQNKKKIFWIDTEQGKHEGLKILRTICKETTGDYLNQPENFHYFNFRPLSYAIRLELTDYLIINSEELGFVVIDGPRDFVSSINNEIEATSVTEKLMQWTEAKNIHILNILHQNKGDGNARGHLGTELINKAETVARIERMDQSGTRLTIIKPDLSRHKEFEKFAFTINDNSEFEIVEIDEGYQPKKPKPNEFTGFQIQDILKFVFSTTKTLPYTKLWQTIKKAVKNQDIDLGDNKCKELVTYLIKENYLNHNRENKHYSPTIPV